ncbi:MAG: DUF1127 domain-containing protein [Pseudomonadota bacterium]
MATRTLTYTRPLFEAAFELYEKVKADYIQYRDYCKTLNELRALDAREIADLGQGHLTAEALAYEAVYGKKA